MQNLHTEPFKSLVNFPISQPCFAQPQTNFYLVVTGHFLFFLRVLLLQILVAWIFSCEALFYRSNTKIVIKVIGMSSISCSKITGDFVNWIWVEDSCSLKEKDLNFCILYQKLTENKNESELILSSCLEQTLNLYNLEKGVLITIKCFPIKKEKKLMTTLTTLISPSLRGLFLPACSSYYSYDQSIMFSNFFFREGKSLFRSPFRGHGLFSLAFTVCPVENSNTEHVSCVPQEALRVVKILQNLDPPFSIDGKMVAVNLATGKRR